MVRSVPDYGDPELNRLFLRSGKWLSGGNAREVLVGEAFAEANRARGLDPISTGSNTAVVYALILAHNLDHALEAAHGPVRRGGGCDPLRPGREEVHGSDRASDPAEPMPARPSRPKLLPSTTPPPASQP